MSLLLSMVLLAAGPGELAAPPPVRAEVPVTWDFEAPDMLDILEFNESGQVSVPLAYEPKRCEEKVSVFRVHMYQFITGSSRRSEKKPECLSAGVVIALGKREAATSPPRRLKVMIEAGETDWTGDRSFSIPTVSARQWNDLPSTTSWVFEVNGVTLPHFWKRVIVSCE